MLKANQFIAGALNLLLSAGSFMIEPEDMQFGQDGPTYCDGNPVGLADLKGREIIPPKFSRIQYVGHDLFMMYGANSADRYTLGDDRFIFNKNGTELKVVPPQGTQLRQILWLGDQADRSPDMTLSTLPKETLLRFVKDERLGICDVNGNVVVEPNFCYIGAAREGVLFLSQGVSMHAPNQRIYLFDVHTRRLKLLPLDNVLEIAGSYFSEGLAAMAFTRGGRSYGYIDQTGAVVIPPMFSEAGPFVGGLASARQWTEQGVRTYSPHVVINKTGAVVSPPDLQVEQFRGDYALASTSEVNPHKYGLVDRKFRFVLPLKYAGLAPVLEYYRNWNFLDYQTLLCRPADYYLARDQDTDNCTVLSSAGKFIFAFPRGVVPLGGPFHGVWSARGPSSKPGGDPWIYFDIQGRQVSGFVPTLPPIKNVTVHQLSPDRLMFILETDDGTFNAEYWREGRWRPIGRLEMFGRLLKEYDIIGMSQEQALRLLEDPRRTRSEDLPPYFSYWIYRGPCAGDLSVNICFEKGKVATWHFSDSGKDSDPISTNVVLADRAETVNLLPIGNGYPRIKSKYQGRQ
jgi:hypothetical protein